MTTTTTGPVKTFQDLTATIAGEKEPCPGCGRMKFKSMTVQEGKTIRLLTCAPCSHEYQGYQAKVVAKMAEDPATPEPMSKFDWLLSRINLVDLREKLNKAIADYRLTYEAKVLSQLRQRKYLTGEPQWTPGPWKRPYVQFSRESHNSGIAEKLRDELEKGIQEEFGQMKQAEGHLKATTKFKAEQDERAAKAEAPAAT